MYHNISLSSLVTVKGRIPFPAWVRVKIIMYPFTFPIKEYGDEVESQQGVPDTQAQSQNVFALLCCHNQDTLNYRRFRLEAVSVFRRRHCSQMKSWGEANEQNNILMIVYTVETWSNFGWLSGQCLPMTPLLVYRPKRKKKRRAADWEQSRDSWTHHLLFIT